MFAMFAIFAIYFSQTIHNGEQPTPKLVHKSCTLNTRRSNELWIWNFANVVERNFGYNIAIESFQYLLSTRK